MQPLQKLSLNKLVVGLIAIGIVSTSNAAGFVEDSKASIQFRNFYFNDDFRSTKQDDRREWAQGFIFKYESGFTEGDIGVGLDALGLWGVRLNLDNKHPNMGFLPLRSNGKSARQAASYGFAAKMKVLDYTTVKSGTQIFRTPMLDGNDGRLLPQTFRGTRLAITPPIRGLDFDAAYVSHTKFRNDTNSEKLVAEGAYGAKRSYLWYAGANYQATDNLKFNYYYSQLKDFYYQQYFALNHKYNFPVGYLNSDIRYFVSRSDGQARSGDAYNQTLALLFIYHIENQSVGFGYQKLNGPSTMPRVAGTSVYTFTNSGIATFDNPHEETWMAHYGFNFKSWGLPGLSFVNRYFKSTNKGYQGIFKSGKYTGYPNRNALKEWERDTMLSYTFQSKPLKGFRIDLLNSKLRTHYRNLRDRDNNRIYLTYTLDLL